MLIKEPQSKMYIKCIFLIYYDILDLKKACLVLPKEKNIHNVYNN